MGLWKIFRLVSIILSAILNAEEGSQPGGVKREFVMNEAKAEAVTFFGDFDLDQFFVLVGTLVDSIVGLLNFLGVFPQTE